MPKTAPKIDDGKRDEVITKAVQNAASILGIKQNQLAPILGISESFITRMKKGKSVIQAEKKEAELAALLVRLYRGLDAIMAGDETSLRQWMNNFNTDLKAVPLEYISNVTGLVDTVSYIDAYRARV